VSDVVTLVSLRYSPWSERARWVLDHHRISYRTLQHDPFLNELRLRHLAGWPRGRVTVPLLLAGERRYRTSWDIACYADSVGSGERLIPDELTSAIAEIDSLAERAMNLGRSLLVDALLADPSALDASWPSWVPAPVASGLRPLARFGTRWFARKYALDFGSLAADREGVRVVLDELRRRSAGRQFLLDRFSYADIIVATCLQLVTPVSDRHWRLEPAQRRVWTRPDLAGDYPDLLQWRDSIYESCRRPAASPSAGPI